MAAVGQPSELHVTTAFVHALCCLQAAQRYRNWSGGEKEWLLVMQQLVGTVCCSWLHSGPDQLILCHVEADSQSHVWVRVTHQSLRKLLQLHGLAPTITTAAASTCLCCC